MVAHEVILEPQAFRTAIAAWRHEPQLWLDTEVADWRTKTPRLSLIQVRNASGRIWVVDVLEPHMRQVLDEDFMPQVMANDLIGKWAHYARFERRFLGPGIKCTFELASSIPYYRLPLRSLSLAALAKHFFNTKLDKTFQKADWRERPLSPAQLEYAALDTEWCYKVYKELRKIPRLPAPSDDDPKAIEARYVELLRPWNLARATHKCIRIAVQEHMIRRKLTRHSRFSLSTRTIHSTNLITLIDFAQEVDPGEYIDLGISLSMRIRSLLGANALGQIQPLAKISVSQSLRGPRAPRLREETPGPYRHARDPKRVTRDYEAADHDVMMLESEKSELHDRMSDWMEAQELPDWGRFRFSRPRERWKIDLRALGRVLTTDQAIQVAFPRRLWLAFPESRLERLFAAGNSTETPVLRWLPRALSVGVDAQQSRDWDGLELGDEPE